MLRHWATEINNWAPRMRACVFHGMNHNFSDVAARGVTGMTSLRSVLYSIRYIIYCNRDPEQNSMAKQKERIPTWIGADCNIRGAEEHATSPDNNRVGEHMCG